ncbi:MAG: AbrB/MazE/SpoVT family DNA-binding domain-containing protein [Anaerolineae bacterium]|jgi:AbrB family looped-hinge helix DNA binding protein|nr:AbrB/MazE/SpoVT family DNA-binding domain-containing protein [Anaerolineae bacterium]
MVAARELVRSLTAKGQVTVPIEVRKLLGVGPADRIVFQIVDGRVELKSAPMTLEETFGAVQPLSRPEDFDYLREVAIAEHARQVIQDLQS